jgi:RNA polymerase sigma-70 factor, ECF subfamily
MGRLEALLRRCHAGDQEALEELVRLWEVRLFYYVRRLVASEADAWDVLQATWVRVVKGIRGVRDPEKFTGWIYRVARNAALSHRASLLARERWVDREVDTEMLTGVEKREAEWSAEDVHAGMEKLAVHHREVLTLFFLEDLTIGEMAQVLDVSQGTVKSRLFYGKRALAEVLELIRSGL